MIHCPVSTIVLATSKNSWKRPTNLVASVQYSIVFYISSQISYFLRILGVIQNNLKIVSTDYLLLKVKSVQRDFGSDGKLQNVPKRDKRVLIVGANIIRQEGTCSFSTEGYSA